MTISSRTEDKSPITLSTRFEKLELEVEELNLPVITVTVEATEASEESTCTTPTGEEYKIPRVLTCPPAPRKHEFSISPEKPRKKPKVTTEFFTSSELHALFGLNS